MIFTEHGGALQFHSWDGTCYAGDALQAGLDKLAEEFEELAEMAGKTWDPDSSNSPGNIRAHGGDRSFLVRQRLNHILAGNSPALLGAEGGSREAVERSIALHEAGRHPKIVSET